MKNKKGKVYLIGAGPGDAGLMTLKGMRYLCAADVVVYDSLVNPELLEMARHAEKIYAGKRHKKRRDVFGQKKRSGRIYDDCRQEQINGLLLNRARKGKQVVRLKGGDPFVFGRGGEEAEYLEKHGIPFEIVPGISAGTGVPAYAGISLTDRRFSSMVVFVTAHEDPSKPESRVNWHKLAGFQATLVLFMGVHNLSRVTQLLTEGGKSPRTPVSVIEWGSLPHQKVVEGNLDNIADRIRKAGVKPPTLTVIGEVNSLRKNLNWFEKRPLFGKKILITRPRHQAGEQKRQLEDLGAAVYECPSIQILPPKSWAAADKAFREISRYDWVVFTSMNGVEKIFERMRALGYDSRIFAGRKIASIGQKTTNLLLNNGIKPDLTPEQFTSEALTEALRNKNQIQGKKFLLFRTDIAPEDFNKALQRSGGQVTQAIAYRTVKEKWGKDKKHILAMLARGEMDYVTFTSASTVDHFFDQLPPQIRKKLKTRFISIGPITSRRLKAHGYRPYREASPHTIEGMAGVMLRKS